MIKVCSKCKEEKPFSDFYKDASRKDGKCGVCKVCTDAKLALYAKTDAGKLATFRAKDKYRRSEHGKARQASYFRTDAGKAVTKRSSKKWRSENREKMLAHKRLQNQVDKGNIVKPLKCEGCGEEKLLCGHHHDYSLPLDVTWLCHLCHVAEHKRIDEQQEPR